MLLGPSLDLEAPCARVRMDVMRGREVPVSEGVPDNVRRCRQGPPVLEAWRRVFILEDNITSFITPNDQLQRPYSCQIL